MHPMWYYNEIMQDGRGDISHERASEQREGSQGTADFELPMILAPRVVK